jgi:ubiquinone/menaquinone biosynthesis C-methylase UbiE
MGVDSSHVMITYAQREEEAHPLGIQYVVGDAKTMEVLGAFDLVTAAYLLVHASTRYQLAAMCQAITKQLKPGGRLVALTINPHLVIDQLPPIEKYQSGVTARGPLHEGAPIDITMLTASGPIHICDYYWSQGTYEDVLQQAGFGTISWHAMRVSAEGLQTYGRTYWQDYLNNPQIVVLEAQK